MRRIKLHSILIFIVLAFLLQNCEPDHETPDVSVVSELAKFEYIGGQFISIVKGSVAKYEEPGVYAFVGDKEFDVASRTMEPVNPNREGVYIYEYFAKNDEGIVSKGRRIVAVTTEDVSDNEDLSGKYIVNGFGVAIEARVKRKNNIGWYSCSEVLGYPGVEVKGEFVDIGDGVLYILPGESYFGKYDLHKGNYTFTTLSWDILFIEEPNDGVIIPVTLTKSED